MAKTTRMTIRLSEDERRQIHDAVRVLGFAGPSPLVRHAIHNELTGRGCGDSRIGGTGGGHPGAGAARRGANCPGQQALFAVIDTLVKTFLTCVPDPPADGMPQSVARARDRYSRFVKAAGQAMVGDALAAMQDLVNHVE